MSNTPALSLCNSCNCMTKTIDGHCGKCEADKPKVEWERTIKAWGWREAVAVVFRRLMPVVNLDESPPVKYLKTNEQLDLSGSEEDVAEIFRQTLTAYSKEVEGVINLDPMVAVKDNDSHRYQIPKSKLPEWEAFCEIPSDDERSWDVPEWADRIDGGPIDDFQETQRQALSKVNKDWGMNATK